MNIINAEDLQFAMGHVNLLDHTDFILYQNEKIGLIGRNGTGKSSFLKILAGRQLLDNGTLHIQRNLKVVYVAQEADFNPNDTVFETVSEGLGNIKELLRKFHYQSILLTKDPGNSKELETLEQLQIQLENNDGWTAETSIHQTLQQLNLPHDEFIKNLSGGQKKRVQLAQAWVQKPDLLLLDEPTNHLDIQSIIWLENLLLDFQGSAIIITHDRKFLDHVVNRIVELDRGKLRSYPGNFQHYQEKKNQEILIELKHNRLFDKFHTEEEAWIRRGIEARRTRNEGRVKRLEELRKERQARREILGSINFSLSTVKLSGKTIAEFKNVNFSYTDQPIIKNYDGIIQRGDKIGLIGPNGIGKTTFLKLVLGELEPTSGEIVRGSRQEIAYFDQFRNGLKDSETVFDTIGQGNDTVTVNGKTRHVISYLNDFLFHPARVKSPVISLSGGERNRLLLAKLLTRPANILILDEPTNDLDIETQELLEQLLRDFSGTIFLVSHDRMFLDNVITQAIVFEGNGKLINYIGGYEDYLSAQKKSSTLLCSKNETNKKETFKPGALKPKNTAKLSYHEKRELELLPKEIENLEQEQKKLTEQLLQPDVFKHQYHETIMWQKRIEEIEDLILKKLERWDHLENKHSLYE